MKTALYFILAIALIAVVAFFYLESKRVISQHASPDGKFLVKVKKVRSGMLHGVIGDNDPFVEVILEDEKGEVIGRSSSNPDCLVMASSISISWQTERNLVLYAKSKSIDLESGKVDC